MSALPAPATGDSTVIYSRPVRRLRALAVAGLWAFVFSIPSASAVVISQPLGTISRLLGIAAAVLGAVALIVGGRHHRLRDVHVLLILYVAWAVLSQSWTVDAAASRVVSGTLIQLLVLVLLLWEFGRADRSRRHLLWAYVLGAWVGVILTAVAILSGAVTSRAAAPGFNTGAFAYVIVLAIPMAWHLSLGTRSRVQLVVARLFVALAVPTVAATGTRGALLVLPLALCIIPLTFDRLAPRGRLLTAAGLILPVLLALTVVPDATLERLSTTPAELRDGDFSGRSGLWQRALDEFDEAPLTGVGVGALRFAVAQDLGDAEDPHNSLLAVAGDLGLVGLALFLLALLSAFVIALRHPPKERLFAIVLLGTLVLSLMPLHAEDAKHTWVVLAFVVAAAPMSPATLTRRGRAHLRRGPMLLSSPAAPVERCHA